MLLENLFSHVDLLKQRNSFPTFSLQALYLSTWHSWKHKGFLINVVSQHFFEVSCIFTNERVFPYILQHFTCFYVTSLQNAFALPCGGWVDPFSVVFAELFLHSPRYSFLYSGVERIWLVVSECSGPQFDSLESVVWRIEGRVVSKANFGVKVDFREKLLCGLVGVSKRGLWIFLIVLGLSNWIF